MRKFINQLSALALFSSIISGSIGCDRPTGGETSSSVESQIEPDETAEASLILTSAIEGAHRTDEERARDKWRHPKETINFFEILPNMTVLEIWPGGGWYTNILAPYLAAGDGMLIAAHFDPTLSPDAERAVAAFKSEFVNRNSLYGPLKITTFSPPKLDLPANSTDAVLTFRNAHNWFGTGQQSEPFKEFYRVLRPGGILGVVDHRADASAADGISHNGYVTEASIISLGIAAGFAFEEKSEINANKADTKNHPFGVWTLLPVRRSAKAPGMREPNFPRERFDAIGESDRMTIRFRKPAK
ncbi:MAG: methyltransferase domain-containing protein [Pseudomonadota bacterium]